MDPPCKTTSRNIQSGAYFSVKTGSGAREVFSGVLVGPREQTAKSTTNLSTSILHVLSIYTIKIIQSSSGARFQISKNDIIEIVA